jgi:hypothetical protein
MTVYGGEGPDGLAASTDVLRKGTTTTPAGDPIHPVIRLYDGGIGALARPSCTMAAFRTDRRAVGNMIDVR